MDLNQIMQKLNAMDDFIPTDLPDRSPIFAEEYCKKHPYFERTVRQIISMYRYIPFSEVLDTMEYLVNNEFRDIIYKNLETNPDLRFVFIYQDKRKSNFYFSLLFLKYLSVVLNKQYWHRVIIADYHTHFKGQSTINDEYVMVDDATYSGRQLDELISHLGMDTTVILIATSQSAYDLLKERELIKKVIVGNIFPDTFYSKIDTMFRNLDIFYESQGQVHTLLGLDLITRATSGFYFQHKFADEISIPQILVLFPDPEIVDKILTLEEKYQALGLRYGTKVTDYDYNIPLTKRKTSLIITDDPNYRKRYGVEPYKAFYKQTQYTQVLN